MSIRYEIDTTGRLHRVVRAGPPAGVERAVLPGPDLPGAPPTALERAAAVIRAAAAALRADANRRRKWGFQRPPHPHGPGRGSPVRDVTGAQLRAARQAVGLSQRALAREFPYGRGLLASVELGYRSCPPDLGAWAKHVLRTTGSSFAPSPETGKEEPV